MKVTVETLPRRQVALNIEADQEEFEEARRHAYQHLAPRARVPGFRQGKAPLALVESFVGKAAFMEEALQHLVPEVTSKAMEEHEVEASGQPVIEDVSTDPVAWKATFDLQPEIDLGAYSEIRITPEPVVLEPETVDAELEKLRFEQAPWEPADRPSAMGDLLTIDILAEQDEKVEADDKGVLYYLEEGSAAPVPGFAEQLVGAEAGHAQRFSLPSGDGEGSGDDAKTYNFNVQVLEVKTKHLAGLDDEFAKGVGDGFESLDALREDMTNKLRTVLERTNRNELHERALQAVIDSSRLEYSPGFVDHEAERMLEEQENRLERNQMDVNEYLTSIGKTREEVLEEFKPSAEQRVVRSLVLSELLKAEGVELSDTEVETELDILAGGSDQVRSALGTPSGRRSLRHSLLTRKTLERLEEIVTGGRAQPLAESEKEASVDDAES